MKLTAPLPRRHRMPLAGMMPCLLLVLGLAGCAGSVSTQPSSTTSPTPPSPAATVPAPRQARPLSAPAIATTTVDEHLRPLLALATTAAMSSLAQRIDAYINQPRFASAQWGINVVALDTGRVLYAHHADKLGIPASNAKLFTAALALSTLGTNDHIQTTLYATAAAHHGVIRGNLILYGRGDPTLGSGNDAHTPTNWADQMATALARRGIKRVHGAIIADATWFAGPAIAPGWEARDLQSWYVPPASALTVQGNMFFLDAEPDHGLCCSVTTTPDMPGIDIVNLAQTNPNASYADLGVYRPPGSRHLFVYGAMQPHAKARHFALSAPDPALMAGELLQDALVRHDIRVDGGVRALHWPRTDPAIGAPATHDIADIRSPPLADIVHHTLKHSDNLYAELLLLQAGHQFAQKGDCPDRNTAPRTTLGWGRCALRALLRRIGIQPHHALFEEGSGLSRKDLVTPRAITTLLAWASHQPFFSAYRSALPIACVDGTLHWRMCHSTASGNVHAKTGTLRYSYTLSGYVTTASGQPLVFSLMLEDYARPTDAQGRRIGRSPQADLDSVAEMLANLGKH